MGPGAGVARSVREAPVDLREREVRCAGSRERVRLVEPRRDVPHLDRAVEAFHGLLEHPRPLVRGPESDPGSGGVETDCGLPELHRGVREAEVREEDRLLRLPRPPLGLLSGRPQVVENPLPHDRAPTLRVQPEGARDLLEGGPFRVLDLRRARQAHRVTSRHRPWISHSSHPGSVASNVPKHSYTPRYRSTCVRRSRAFRRAPRASLSSGSSSSARSKHRNARELSKRARWLRPFRCQSHGVSRNRSARSAAITASPCFPFFWYANTSFTYASKRSGSKWIARANASRAPSSFPRRRSVAPVLFHAGAYFRRISKTAS